MSKSLSLTEFNRLQKFMGLTMSEHDGEALAALRQANKILSAHKIAWQDVFNKLVTLDVEEAQPEPEMTSTAQTGSIEEAFRMVKARMNPRSGFASFIQSLEEQWYDKQWLSPAQREALFKAAANAREPSFRR